MTSPDMTSPAAPSPAETSSRAPVLLGVGSTLFSVAAHAYPAFDLAAMALRSLRQQLSQKGAAALAEPTLCVYAGPHPRSGPDSQSSLNLPAALGVDCPIVPLVADDAGGSRALHTACALLEGKSASTVLVLGVSRFSHLLASENTHYAERFLRALLLPPALQALVGDWTSPFALSVQRYLDLTGQSATAFAKLAVARRLAGKSNPLAALKLNLTEQEYAARPAVSGPLRDVDISPLSDGAVALLLGTPDLDSTGSAVRVAATAQACSYPLAWPGSPDSWAWPSLTQAAERLDKATSGSWREHLLLAEVDDRVAGLDALTCEALGLCPKGSGLEYLASSGTKINGSGGYHALGFGGAAQGLARVASAAERLSAPGSAPQFGLVQETAGLGVTSVLTLLTSPSPRGT